ncbi:hypothetical protein JXI42_09370 [bacterium]|nr:hypothetical protein [bacterium]
MYKIKYFITPLLFILLIFPIAGLIPDAEVTLELENKYAADRSEQLQTASRFDDGSSMYYIIIAQSSETEGENGADDFVPIPLGATKDTAETALSSEVKWSTEKWLRESSYDRGVSYRAVGAMSGFTFGSAIGMVVGKGFQGKKLVRSEYHDEEWGESSWTENFYSYEHRYAPYYGAFLGGTAGAMAGYFIGKQEDKEYYVLVPRDIRMEYYNPEPFKAPCVGIGLNGTFLGIVSGLALYAPYSSVSRDMDFGWQEAALGFTIGSLTGTMIFRGIDERNAKKRKWEESKDFWDNEEIEERESPFDVQLIPLDQYPNLLHIKEFPDGETCLDYNIAILRVNF